MGKFCKNFDLQPLLLHNSSSCRNEIVTDPIVQAEQPKSFSVLPSFQISATSLLQIYKLQDENITNHPSASLKMAQETAY